MSISIRGDSEFVRKAQAALAMAYKAPNAYLLGSVREIVQGDPNANRGASGSGGVVELNQAIRSSEAEIAAILIHEAAHCHHKHHGSTPDTERIAVREENIARGRLGLGAVSDDWGQWAALGISDTGAVSTEQRQATPAARNSAQSAPNVRTDPVAYWQWRVDTATSGPERSSANYRLHEVTRQRRRAG